MVPCEFTPAQRSLLLALVAVGCFPGASTANAWQQYHTSAGKPMRWSAAALQQPLPYSLDETGLSGDGLAPWALAQSVQEALAQWAGLTCAVTSDARAPLCAAGEAAIRSLGVSFQWLGWGTPQPIGLGCAAGDSPPCSRVSPNGNQITFVHAAADWPYGKDVIAMTVVSAAKSTGFIADADIAVNDARYSFCLASCLPGQIHFGAVALHEAGHFLGLDHSAVASAVMNAAPPQEILHPGTLQADDNAGACAAYPEDATPVTCAADAHTVRVAHASGCNAARGPAALPWAALLALGWWSLRRWRSASRAASP